MAIQSVSVPVPVSGDGAAVSIANLVGKKSVVLTGLFEGQYAILAGHEPGIMVPVLRFDAGGEAGIEQTLPDAYQYVAVRAQVNTTVQGSPVTVVVNGVVGVGQNDFASLATLAPGMMGPQPSIDTYALFPPTGLETGINIICEGLFEGNVIIEGSDDNATWNPIGQFSATPIGRTLLGTPRVLEFGPLSTQDLIRYVRVNVAAKITGNTNLTIGGQIPASGSGPSGTNLAIVTSSALNAGFYFAGPPATGSVFTDALGNVVNYTGSGAYGNSDIVCIGSVNQLIASYGTMVVIGNKLVAYGADIIVIGDSSGIAPASGQVTGNYGDQEIIIGANNLITNTRTEYNTLIGTSLTINGEYSDNNVLMGTSISLANIINSSSNVLIGNYFGAGDNSHGNLVIVPESASIDLTGSQNNVVLGNNHTLSSDLQNCVLVGTVNTINNDTPANLAPNIIAIGLDVTAHAVSTTEFGLLVLIGTTITAENLNSGNASASKAVAIGDTITLEAATEASSLDNFSQVVLIGSTLTATVNTPDGASHVACVGDNSTLSASGYGVNHVQALGSYLTVKDACSHCVAVGDNISMDVASEMCVVVGRNNQLTLAAGYPQFFFDVVCVGDSNTLTGSNLGNVVVAGASNTMLGQVQNSTLVGQTNKINASQTEVTDFVHVVGDNNTVGTSGPATDLVVFGSSNTVDDGSEYSVAIGYDNNLYGGTGYTNVIGQNNTSAVASEEAVIIGDSNAINGVSPVTPSNIVMIGLQNLTNAVYAGIANYENLVLIGSNVTASNQNDTNALNLSSVVAIGNSVGAGAATGGTGDYNNNINQAVLIGSSVSCFASMVGSTDQSSHIVQIGDQIGSGYYTGKGVNYIQAIGSKITVPDNCQHFAILGDNISFLSVGTVPANYCTTIGQSIQLGSTDNSNNADQVVAIGSNLTIGGVNSAIAIGTSINIPTHLGLVVSSVIAIGFGITLSLGNYQYGGIVIGNGATITPGSDYAIALGTGTVASNGQCVIGANSGTDFQPIHELLVQGYITATSSPLITLDVIDTPVQVASPPTGGGVTGLTIVLNNGTNIAPVYNNVTLKAVPIGHLPPNALVAYFDTP
jgi:hypothetical protein